MYADGSAGGTAEDTVRTAEASRRAMARLVAVAGHDLKQPLQLAILSVGRAVADGVPAPVARRLNIALDAMERLGSELSDIARLSQQGGGLQPRRRAIRLTDILAQLEREWAFYAEVSHTRLRIRPCDAVIVSDPNMLLTILRNLVGNAIKYCGPGGHVDVGCRIGPNSVTIDIRDDGGGIPAERLVRIFDAFERGDHAGQQEGLGLGLLIVRQTAELLRHTVSVRSIENVGSTFSVEVPRPDGELEGAGRLEGRA